jgi:hypothetical protein
MAVAPVRPRHFTASVLDYAGKGAYSEDVLVVVPES